MLNLLWTASHWAPCQIRPSEKWLLRLLLVLVAVIGGILGGPPPGFGPPQPFGFPPQGEQPHLESMRFDGQAPASQPSGAEPGMMRFKQQPPPPPPPGGPLQHHWMYQDQENWMLHYPKCKDQALRQSPIDIITSETVRDDRMSVVLVDYNQMIGIKTTNNGHSACINPIAPLAEAAPRLRLQGFPGSASLHEYELVEMHFHWGDENKFGSEHKLNGDRASAEMHMVHFRKGIEKWQIGNVENSIVVLAVFLEPSMFHHNHAVDEVVDDVSLVNGTDVGEEKCSGKLENLRNVVPLINSNFYAYNGSLTTPPCYEVVTWVVIDQPVYITRRKLLQLQNLETRDETGTHKIDVNFRETQPLRNRPVFVSKSLQQLTTNPLKEFLNISMPKSKQRQKLKRNGSSGKARKPKKSKSKKKIKSKIG